VDNRYFLFYPFWIALLVFPFLGLIHSLVAGLFVFAALCISRAIRAIPLSFYGRLTPGFIASLRMNPGVAARGKWILLGLLLVIPAFLDNYQIDVMTMTGLYIVLALGLNIVVGFAGLLDLGYAAFYAVGAYSDALLSVHFHISFWILLILSGLIAGIFGILLGVITLRLKGDYLAIVTLGFIQIIHLVLNNWDTVTQGPKGIAGIAHPAIGGFAFSRPVHFYYLILLIALLALVSIHRIDRSRFGRAWSAMRDDEIAAEAMGIHTTRMKILAFSMGSAWAGVSGAFFAGKIGFVSPESFTFFESILILSMIVLGGIGSIPGVIMGAVLLMILPEVLRGLSDYRMLLFGSAMILMMVWRPQGMVGRARRIAEAD
jgi:branched-chain amino acid transport system permease protein